jgi:two-component system cell cycle sensor histidine kinase/response regulator CckA
MRVLLVEDNPVDAATLGDRLAEHAGESPIEIEHVSSLAELATRDATEFDVLVLDLSLPDGFGAGSIRKARMQVGEMPIVVLTADDNEQRSLEMLREGAEDYLVKGKYSADTLVRALRYACERHALKQRLAHADRLAAVGQLSAGVAHEVANPAALAIANNGKLRTLLAELIAPGNMPTPERVREIGGECARVAEDNRTALERIRAVVRDLQTYSRLERSRVERVQINEIVDRTCNLVNASLRHGATLDKHLSTLPAIAADEGKIEQVLTNLLINAIHALEHVEDKNRPNGKHIVVTTRVDGDAIMLSVTDNGCGMTDAVRQRAFEPFFTTKREHGTGLGLAIAIEIVRRHRGEITCTSSVNEGARFDVRIPIDTGLDMPAAAPEAPLPHALNKRGRVLLVDDERAVAMVYGELLSMHHEVVIAHGGKQAVELLDKSERFDVIVCDLMMPELDGVGVFETAVGSRPELASRFVFCSGGLVTARARELAARPNTRLLYKPVSIDDMLRAIDTVITDHSSKITRGSKPPA